MKPQPDTRWEHVRGWLRRNDPGTERPLDAQEQLEIRRRMLARPAGRRPTSWPRRDWRVAASVLLVVAAGVAWWGWQTSRDAPSRHEPVVEVGRFDDPGSRGDVSRRGTENAAGPRAATLEVRFAAPQGTQLVWILQTDGED